MAWSKKEYKRLPDCRMEVQEHNGKQYLVVLDPFPMLELENFKRKDGGIMYWADQKFKTVTPGAFAFPNGADGKPVAAKGKHFQLQISGGECKADDSLTVAASKIASQDAMVASVAAIKGNNNLTIAERRAQLLALIDAEMPAEAVAFAQAVEVDTAERG